MYNSNINEQEAAVFAEQRRQLIRERVYRDGSVNVGGLCEELGVSEMTIRRDLIALEREGLVQRVHGGAVSVRGRSYEPPFLLRDSEHTEEKARVARAAAALVQPGDSIALDVGTTTLNIARALTDIPGLTVITPSLHILQLLADRPGIRLIATGGQVRPGERSMVGPLVERIFSELFVDKLFLGIAGIDLQAGLTEYNLEDATSKRAMMASAKQIILPADSSKFGRVAFVSVAPVSSVHRIITDEGIDPQIRARLRQLGIQVDVTPAEGEEAKAL
jgi:DeoR/GlpR family transcriptional regulator of sugar metabolism